MGGTRGHTAGTRGEPGVVLIVGAARSGTTLLRLLFDGHPEIGCPPEAGIPSLIGTLGRVWWTIRGGSRRDGLGDPLPAAEPPVDRPGEENDDLAAARTRGVLSELPGEAIEAIREAAIAPMRHYCEREGKRIYCDKSLDSVYHLEPFCQMFPETRYVLLFRHVMDTVASGIEASPWGFQAYGYLPFVQRSPDNFVAALVNYWLSHVAAALKWEERHPELCHRVRYEDLVTDPIAVVDKICSFLGVESDSTALERAFAHARSTNGPGDYKVTFSSSVDPSSIGRGKRVPVQMVPPPLLEAVNEKLKSLGYEAVDQSWNAEPIHRNGRANEVNAWAAELAELMGKVRLPPRHESRPIDSFALVAQDNERARWVIDLAAGTIRQGNGEVECVITGTSEDLALLVSGQVNTGVLLRSGRIRHLSAHDNAHPIDMNRTIQLVVGALADRRGSAGQVRSQRR